MQQPEPASQPYNFLVSAIEKGDIKIPQFQRDFVWPIQQSAALIDSILRGYPIGTFIMWRTKDRLRAVRNIGGAELPTPGDGDAVSYVLDGQQRMTSIFAAIKGLKIDRETGQEDFGEIRVDLEANLDDADRSIVVVGAEGREPYSTIRVTDLLHGGLGFLTQYPPHTHSAIETLKSRLGNYLFSVILVKDAPLDIATEIFTRINVSGKTLSPFEIMVAKTYDSDSNFDLVERVEKLQEDLQTCEFETIPDIVFVQTVAAILKRDVRRKTIFSIDRKQFLATWDRAEVAIRRAVDYFRSGFHIPASRLLPYPSLIIPFAYFFDRHPNAPSGEEKTRLRDLFWRTGMMQLYSAGAESSIARDLKRVDEILVGQLPEYDPTEEQVIDDNYIYDNGFFRTSSGVVKAILCLLASKGPRSFATGDLVILDNDWLVQANSRNYHHVFPKAWLQKRGWESFDINHVANIAFVDEFSNKALMRDKAPSTYMREFQKKNGELDSAMKTHLIRLDDAIWENDYEKFRDSRCRWIAREINKFIIPRAPRGVAAEGVAKQ